MDLSNSMIWVGILTLVGIVIISTVLWTVFVVHLAQKRGWVYKFETPLVLFPPMLMVWIISYLLIPLGVLS